MNPKPQNKVQVSYGPCPPEEFAGRFDEKSKFLEILNEAGQQGQMILISGARGSGKSSFLEWAEYEIQNKLESPAIKKAFLETPGMIFITYRDLLADLKGHQKFGWFKKTLNNPKVKSSIGVALEFLEMASPLSGPAKFGVDFGVTAAKKMLPEEPVEYSKLLSSFLLVLRDLSTELTGNNHILAIVVDDAQLSSEPDFMLLKDLIQHLPPAIVFIAAFRLEAEKIAIYEELRQELDRFGHTEICLSGMIEEEIKDLAKLRYGLSTDDSTAQFLRKNIGDPLCLVRCFNLLQRDNLPLNLANVQRILPDAINPARSIYLGLNQTWKNRMNTLCILHPPLDLSLIACMLGIDDLANLKDELDQSIVFRRLKKEQYDFAHASLREYCRGELPESMAIKFHSQAAKCFETLRERFPEWYVDFSLAEHLFFGQEYKKALELNLRLGGQLYYLFDYATALELIERAMVCAEKVNNKSMLASALHQKGMIFQGIFRFSNSLDFYNQSLKIKREIGDSAGEAQTLHQIGMVYEDTNNFEQALDFYNQSLKIEQEIGDRVGEAITLHQIGRVNELTNNFEQSLDIYNLSLKIVREIGDRAGEAQTLHQIGIVNQKTNNFEQALDFYNLSLKIEREIGDRAGEAQTLHQIGRINELTNNFEQALDFYNQSLRIKREIGYRAGEAMTLHQIGMVYEDTNNFEQALDFYNQSLKIEREIGYRAGEAMTLHQIGRVNELTNNFEQALDFYNQSLKIEREIGNRAGEAMTLHQIGMVYEDTNNFEQAPDFYNQSLKIVREIGDRAGEAQTLHQIGRVNELTNNFEQALDFYNQSLKIKREIGDRAGEAQTLHQIGIVNQKTNNFEQALDFYNQSLKIKREIGYRAGEAPTLHQIGMVYEDTNNFEPALDFYNQSLIIEQELGNKSGAAISLQAIEALEEKMLKKKEK